MKINLRGNEYNLTRVEVSDLRLQLSKKRFVMLDTDGDVVGKGDVVTSAVLDDCCGNPGIDITLDNDESTRWHFFQNDEYTIVTRKQYEALKAAGLAK